MSDRLPVLPKPIDIAIGEIEILKKQIIELEIELEPLKKDLFERQMTEKNKDKECVIESKAWWWS
tara:strand:+ start:96 stop:290 length:195 start_codon:yes stop_codon:yes gene_type:complete